jgi:hypothetical protein
MRTNFRQQWDFGQIFERPCSRIGGIFADARTRTAKKYSAHFAKMRPFYFLESFLILSCRAQARPDGG